MRTITLPTIAGDVLVVEVPKDSYDYTIAIYDLHFKVKNEIKGMPSPFNFESSVFIGYMENDTRTILGTIDADTCTVDCSFLFQCELSFNHPAHDWCHGKPFEGNAADSFRSLLEANWVVFFNKYGAEPIPPMEKKFFHGIERPEQEEYDIALDAFHWANESYKSDLYQWQQEQQGVWGKGVCLLINKPEVK